MRSIERPGKLKHDLRCRRDSSIIKRSPSSYPSSLSPDVVQIFFFRRFLFRFLWCTLEWFRMHTLGDDTFLPSVFDGIWFPAGRGLSEPQRTGTSVHLGGLSRRDFLVDLMILCYFSLLPFLAFGGVMMSMKRFYDDVTSCTCNEMIHYFMVFFRSSQQEYRRCLLRDDSLACAPFCKVYMFTVNKRLSVPPLLKDTPTTGWVLVVDPESFGMPSTITVGSIEN
ncbi:uncharacterized protein B0T15DRAFT_71209 [Chaetomium strumarium]|uniref:Uncharacterized protein n=1 Tax=Chaetomium strumarium TaxID=1170767 RepID=A0AAJ0M759_9PEZI|nr:hypothetical protein B0T15DRAFT_71209 [Chaetomium strumarium]